MVITHDGFLLTSAHVVGRHPVGLATFADGAEARVEVLTGARVGQPVTLEVARAADVRSVKLVPAELT